MENNSVFHKKAVVKYNRLHAGLSINLYYSTKKGNRGLFTAEGEYG